jgi:hypothetical protein
MSKLAGAFGFLARRFGALGLTVTLPALTPVPASAQEATLQGTVVEERTGLAVPSAIVTLVGSNLQARTGPDGAFALSSVRTGAVILRVQAPGYPTVVDEVMFRPGTTVVLQVPVAVPQAALDEIVVNGSRSPSASDAGARTAADLVARQVPNLQGFTGAFNSSRGRAMSPRVQTRGTSSFSGSAEPVIVLDGARLRGGMDALRQIPAAHIKSIKVLKGPSAAFLYGSAEGVIYIQTESGPPPP